jgi:hypothetical protein
MHTLALTAKLELVFLSPLEAAIGMESNAHFLANPL